MASNVKIMASNVNCNPGNLACVKNFPYLCTVKFKFSHATLFEIFNLKFFAMNALPTLRLNDIILRLARLTANPGILLPPQY